jgi:hypothetical protein
MGGRQFAVRQKATGVGGLVRLLLPDMKCRVRENLDLI